MQRDHFIAAVHVTDRLTQSLEVQKLLTEYGCNIRMRLGLHDAGPDACSPNGLLILELVGEKEECEALLEKLNAIEGVEGKCVTFTHH